MCFSWDELSRKPKIEKIVKRRQVMTRIIIEFEVSRDQIQSVYNFSVHKGLSPAIVLERSNKYIIYIVLLTHCFSFGL